VTQESSGLSDFNLALSVVLTRADIDMNRREEWRKVLDSEVKRWVAMSCSQLLSELHDPQAYEIEFDFKKYQVEVELLENTDQYLHVVVAVDDGSLPASMRPLTHSFIRSKEVPAV
jgi:hypothetical protein